MKLEEIRSQYIAFFEKHGHKEIAPAPLVLENDPTTLFTSSGMQPLVPYLLGEIHPSGKRLVNSQPSIRVQDIEEVGDNRHTTFFEMLGNWSLGDYFKDDQLGFVWKFLTDEKDGLGLPKEKLYVSIFEGNSAVPRDEASFKKWIELGVEKDHIFEYGVKKNWWSRSGTPDQMPAGEIGGPDSEIFFEFEGVTHDSAFGEKCHPNCDCGRFLEIGNSVFIQYKKKENGSLEELPQKNVDFGGGLERIAAATIDNPDVFETDVFKNVISILEQNTGENYNDKKIAHSMRIIADHLRASVFLLSEGVFPSNKQQGYVLRRLLRRAIVKVQKLKSRDTNAEEDVLYNLIAGEYIASYSHHYPKLQEKASVIQQAISDERNKFAKTLQKGLKEVEKINEIDGKIAFDLYQTYGFPLELSIEIFQEKGQQIDIEQFKKAFEEHQNKSRTASAGTFKGGLMDHSVETTRLHTATHLLHAALRDVLGSHVQQKGSNITHERLRFDFTHPEKVTGEEMKKIETLINEQIDQDLPVNFSLMTIEEADKKGALHFFDKKYDDQVKVYTIGKSDQSFFSREVCGGPHVSHLSELGGHVRIDKEEAVSAGVRRIYATIG